MEIYALILSAILVSSYLLEKTFHLNLFSDSSNPIDNAIGFSSTTTCIFIFSSCLVYPFYKYLLLASKLEFLKVILIFISIEITTRAVYSIAAKIGFLPLSSNRSLFPSLTVVNCAILGVILLNLTRNINFLTYIIHVSFSALGFSIFFIMFIAVKEKLLCSDVPKPFKGLAIDFLTVGFVAIGCEGFGGFLSY